MRRHARFGGSVLVTIVVGALLMTSCSTPSPPTTQTSTTETKPYGALTIGINFHGGTIASVTGKGVIGSSTFQILVAPIFDSLVEVSPEGQPRPGISERWEISPDGLTHTFYIRKGVKFHDGSDLTAADVKFSIEENMMGDPSKATRWSAQFLGVDVKDDYTVALRVKKPQFELLVGLESLEGYGAVLPKKYIEEKGWDYFGRNPVGSGPWKVVKFEPSTRMELEAVESHWRAVPKFRKLTLIHLLEEATKVAMLKTGELDIAEISPESVATLKAAGLRIVSHYGASQWYLFLFYDLDNPQKHPLGDVRVRKALSLGIDRRELAEKIWFGYAQPLAVFFVSKTAYFYDPNVLKPDPYDPDQAKRLIAESGYPNGFSTKVWDAGAGGFISTVNTALVGYWRKIGVNAELAPRDYPTMGRMWQSPDRTEGWNTLFSYPFPGGLFHFERIGQMYHSRPNSTLPIRNLKLDELIDKVPLTADANEKKRMALEAAVLVKNEYASIGVVDIDTLFAHSAKVGELIGTKGISGLGPTFELISHPR